MALIFPKQSTAFELVVGVFGGREGGGALALGKSGNKASNDLLLALLVV